MIQWRQTIEQHRQAALAVVMGVALAASVGVAAWLSASRGASVRRGAEVLREIRRRGLRAFWGEEPVSAWYLLRSRDGRPKAWWCVERVPTDGGYQGTSVHGSAGQLTRESWDVDEMGRSSSYRASVFQFGASDRGGSYLFARMSGTRIELRGHRVEVQHEGLGRIQGGVSEPPENYIPEGLNDLAYFLAAGGDGESSFAVILNEQAVAGNRAHFTSVGAEPLGGGRVGLTVAGSRRVLTFDPNGGLVRLEPPDTGEAWQRASAEDVQKAFPNALALRERALRG